MSESKVKDESFFLVTGWMLNRLDLKGVALQIFSIIYGFSQDGESYFTGSLQYLSDFTNASKPTVIKAIKELVERKLIIKVENEMNGVKFCKYRANLLVVKKLNGGSKETLPGGGKETLLGGSKVSLPNNITLDNIGIDKDRYKIEGVVSLYHQICISLPKLRKVNPKREKAILKLLATYSFNDFKTMFEQVEASSFLTGKSGSGWSATFDWLMDEANMEKVLEGNYADKPRYGRNEVPMGCGPLGKSELEAARRMMNSPDPDTAGNNPDIADRADRLRKEIMEGNYG